MSPGRHSVAGAVFGDRIDFCRELQAIFVGGNFVATAICVADRISGDKMCRYFVCSRDAANRRSSLSFTPFPLAGHRVAGHSARAQREASRRGERAPSAHLPPICFLVQSGRLVASSRDGESDCSDLTRRGPAFTLADEVAQFQRKSWRNFFRGNERDSRRRGQSWERLSSNVVVAGKG